MTNNKRIISFILSLVLVFSVFSSALSVHTFAAGNPALSAEAKTVSAGEQFTVTVSLANATSVYGGNFTLQYDSSLLTVDSYEFSSIVSGHTKNCNLDYQSAGNLIRVTFSGASALSSSGALITFTFTAKENVSGSAALQFNAYKMYDENGSSITSSATGSTITVVSESVVSPEISITSKTVNVGETVSVPVVINNSDDVYGGNFTLQYDSSLLTVESYSFGNIISGHTKNCNLDYQSAGNLIRFTFSGSETVSSDGTLVTFTFTAKAEGTAELKFNAYKMYDENGSSIVTTSVNGSIIVQEFSDDITTGWWTSDIYWELNKTTGTLTLNGSGALPNYGFSSTNTPWYYSPACDYIKTVEITEGITSVGSFEHCSKLEKVVLPKSVTVIDGAAFENCSKLTSIDIHSGITEIGAHAFSGCVSLMDITLPDTIETIGMDAFRNTGYYNNQENWDNGILYIDNCLIAMEEDYSGNFYMNDYTQVIADYAFYYCENLTSIRLSNNIDCIPYGAFYCTGLESITIPDSIAVIKEDAFLGSSLTDVVLGSGVTTIEEGAFSGCYNISEITIPEQVESIGKEAFYCCESLLNIIILNKNVIIGDYAFGYTHPTSHYSNYTTIYGFNGSTAQEYALNNDIIFIALDRKTVNNISINSNPSKTIYYIGDSLNTSGLKILVTYSDGSTETVTSGFTTSGFSSTTAGTKTVTVSYEGKTTTFNVTVNTPTITLSSSSKSMNVGDTSTITATTTPNGQTVTWSSSNTSVATVSNGKITAKSAGTATITAKFTYNGTTYSKTCVVTVAVIDDNTDTTKPTGSISSTNNVASSQTVTLNLSDNDGVAGYYWGTSSTYSNNRYESAALVYRVEMNISNPGTYYLVVKDMSGNVSSSYSITFYKTTLDANGGSVSPSYILTKSGNTVTLPTPTKSDATFVGWGTSSNATSGVNSVTPTSNKTYYAVWKAVEPDIITGECGSNATFSFDKNTGVLSIAGFGDMYYWGETNTTRQPWWAYRNEITSVVIDNGITSIGSYAFAFCNNIESIKIPNSITSIEKLAIYECNLDYIIIPKSVEYIGDRAFAYPHKNGDCTVYAYVDSYAEPYADIVINKLAMSKVPNKNKYYLGDSLDLTGLELEMVLPDLTVKKITNNYTVSGFDSNTGGTKTIQIRYNNQIVEFSVNVIGVTTPKLTSCYNEVKGVQLKWNVVSGAKSYKVYRKLPSQTTWALINTTTALAYQDTNVKGNTIYQYSVKAIDQYGNESAFSAQRECRFIETPELISRTNAVGGVTIKWNKVEGATSYRIYRRGAGVNYWYYLGDFPATLDTFTDLETANYFPDDASKNALAKPKSGNYYRYTVRASYDGKDSAGKTYTIYSGFDTNGLYLKYVATPKLTSISNATNGLQIKWNSVAGGGPVEYRVYRRGAGSTYWYYLGTTTNTTWIDSGVKSANGGYYRYTVRAVAGTNGNGWYSAFDTTGLYLMRLANPTLKSAISTNAGITVKWSAIKGTTGYYVYRKTANSEWQKIATVSGTNNTTFVDASAKKGTTYTYTVRAVYGRTTSYFNSGISCYDKY